MTNNEAGALFLSPSTIATHLKRVYECRVAYGRAALTRWAADRGHLAGVGPA